MAELWKMGKAPKKETETRRLSMLFLSGARKTDFFDIVKYPTYEPRAFGPFLVNDKTKFFMGSSENESQGNHGSTSYR